MNWKGQVEDFAKGLRLENPDIVPEAIRAGFFGSTGSGKSVTALMFAIAITPEGRIGVVDCENHRSSMAVQIACRMAAEYYKKPVEYFLEKLQGNIIYLEPPFHPLRAVAALDLIEQRCKTALFDGITAIWESEGGYLDLKNDEVDRMKAGGNKSEAQVAQAAAAHVKPWTHQKFVNRLNNSKASIVMCIQAKKKWDPVTKKVQTYETPIQESGFTRNFVVVGAVEPDDNGKGGLVDFTNVRAGCKFTDPQLLELLPQKGERFMFSHGEAVREWCHKPHGPGTFKAPEPSNRSPGKTELLKKLRDLTTTIHGWTKEKGGAAWPEAKAKLEKWLLEQGIITDTETLDSMSEGTLLAVIEQAQKKIPK